MIDQQVGRQTLTLTKKSSAARSVALFFIPLVNPTFYCLRAAIRPHVAAPGGGSFGLLDVLKRALVAGQGPCALIQPIIVPRQGKRHDSAVDAGASSGPQSPFGALNLISSVPVTRRGDQYQRARFGGVVARLFCNSHGQDCSLFKPGVVADSVKLQRALKAVRSGWRGGRRVEQV